MTLAIPDISKAIPDISKQVYKEDSLSVLMNNYPVIGTIWVNHQMEWSNRLFSMFKDHDKALIIIYLIKKTLDFYTKNFVKFSYEEYFSKKIIKIGKFNIIEISNNLNIPKETARRKLIELEKAGIIIRGIKTILIDRSAFRLIKPNDSITRISHFLSVFSKLLADEKFLSKPLTSIDLKKNIEKHFSYIWKIYYDMQIDMMINYKKIFNDLETWHIFGTCAVNQHIYSKKVNNSKMNRKEFLTSISSDVDMLGINAMSISDVTGIPRATVVRKLNELIKKKILTIDKKKHYKVSSIFIKKLLPLQNNVLHHLSDFSSKIFNLTIL